MSSNGVGKVTVASIAEECGLSKAAVSYALRGKRGVGEDTRRRVEEAARRLGWQAPTPRRLASPDGVNTVGLLVPQPIEVLTEESFTGQFISGLKSALGERGVSLLIDFEVDKRTQMEIYRSWVDMKVTRVVLMDVEPDDFRLTHLPRLGISSVSTCPPVAPDVYPCVYTDDGADMRGLLSRLHADGHRRIVHVSGPSDHPQVARRVAAWNAFCREHPEIETTTHPTDWVVRSSYSVIEECLLTGRPDCVVFDSDRLALLGLRASQRLGLRMGHHPVSLVSFDDSLLCNALDMAAVGRDPRELGRLAANTVLAGKAQKSTVLPRAGLVPRATYRPQTIGPTKPTVAGPRRSAAQR